MGRVFGYWFEKFWPWIAAGAAAVLWSRCGSPFPSDPDGLFAAAAAVAAIFASFLGVAEAIILSIKGTDTYRILEKLEYTNTLFEYLRTAIYASVLFASLCILGFFIAPDSTVFGYEGYFLFKLVWVFMAALSLATYARITNVLFKLLKLS